MGIGGKLGFGKKEQYKAPREAVALRMKIEAESRENFPNLERYRELGGEAEQVYRLLDAEIAKKKHAEEASKISEEIRAKLQALAGRIKRNMREAEIEAKGGTGDSKMDFLSQKSVRDNAKTLFTEFLEGHELFISTCKTSSPDRTGQISAAGVSLTRQLETLRDEFFSKYDGDQEIQGLRAMTLGKVTELIAAFQAHKPGMSDRDAVLTAERHLARLLTMSEGIAD